jgi:hypothetical protein
LLSRHGPVAWEELSKVTIGRRANFSEPPLRDMEDIEEFPLLLRSGDVSDLIEVARQHGVCAAGLARLLIHDYLSGTRSDFAKTVDGVQQHLAGEPR